MRSLATGLLLLASLQAYADETLESAVVLAKSELAARGIPEREIRTVKAEAVVWRDTSLGCGKPNESYAQIDIEGFHVLLAHLSRQFDYRIRKDGRLLLCDAAMPTPR